MENVAIVGNTFPVKDQIKALGGRWNADQKAWMVPADKAEHARQLVCGAPKMAFSGHSNKCKGCGIEDGKRVRGNFIKLRRDGICWDCYEEQRGGC